MFLPWFWQSFVSFSFSLQSWWQSWTKYQDSSQGARPCPPRYVWPTCVYFFWFLSHKWCSSVVTGILGTATPGASAVHGNSGSPQEEPGTYIPPSHTVPHPGGGTSQPSSRGGARGQVQPGPQKPQLWGIWWASKSEDEKAPLLFQVSITVCVLEQQFGFCFFFSAPPPILQRYQGYSSCGATCGWHHRNGAAGHLQQRARESVQQLHSGFLSAPVLWRHPPLTLWLKRVQNKTDILISFRDPPATSAARKQSTPRPTVGTRSALESGVSSAGPASGTVTERRSEMLCWIR